MCATFKKYLYLLSLLVFVYSCTERVDLDLEVMNPVPVITGVISDEEQWVKLSTTSAYLDGKGNVISDALVVVSDGINSHILQESLEEKGLYKSLYPIIINPSLEYELNVQADFTGDGVSKAYAATSKVAPTPQLDSLSIQVMRAFDDLFWFIQVSYQDVSEPNSYLCRVFVNEVLDVGMSSYSIFDNRYGQGSYMAHKLVTVLLERPLSEEKIQVGDHIRVSFSGITKEYFDFLYSAKKETGEKNPIFSGPPANVKGNISNGALGMFTVYQTCSLSVTISDAWS